jgi:hypothetical protein
LLQGQLRPPLPASSTHHQGLKRAHHNTLLLLLLLAAAVLLLQCHSSRLVCPTHTTPDQQTLHCLALPLLLQDSVPIPVLLLLLRSLMLLLLLSHVLLLPC